MAEGTPLERVQVVNSGARVQIPPSPFCYQRKDNLKKDKKLLKKLLTKRKSCDSMIKLSRGKQSDNKENLDK